MRSENLLKYNTEELQFAVHGKLKDWMEHQITAAIQNAYRRRNTGISHSNRCYGYILKINDNISIDYSNWHKIRAKLFFSKIIQ